MRGVAARLVGSGPVQFFRVRWQADRRLALVWPVGLVAGLFVVLQLLPQWQTAAGGAYAELFEIQQHGYRA